MRNIYLVARREYLEQVRKRAFLLSTILVPVFFGVIIAVSVLSGRGLNTSKHLVVASTQSGLASEVRDQLMEDKNEKSQVEAMNAASAGDRSALAQRVRDKAIDGFLWIDSSPDGQPRALYESLSSGDFATAEKLREALNRVLTRQRLVARKIDASEVDSLLKGVPMETQQIDTEGKEVKSNFLTSFFKGYLMAILLMMTTMMYGMNVARSIIQEKTSRIYEVILAIAKPGDILAGKLVGAGAVGLTQIAIWAFAGMALAGTAAAGSMMSGNLSLHFSWEEGILFPVYYLLGYLLTSSIFAGLAASCETEQELQMFAPVISVPVALSFSLILVVINNPSGWISVAASLFPLTAPIIMMFRMGSQMPPAWQFAASIALMVVCIWASLWISAKLYRVGILMYGKRATLPEILRWLRYN
ncbi:MAG: ABC transporter permease [Terracidiphilus sp.]